MQKGDKLFIRIDQSIEGSDFEPQDIKEHIKYLKNISKERFFMGGGFNNAVGGMIIFAAQDMCEAKQIADGDPLIKKRLYTYELKEWELVIVSNKR